MADTTAKPETLSEICDGLFAHVCRLNRAGRMGVKQDSARERVEVKALLDGMSTRAAAAGLSRPYAKAELVLMYFIDFMIKESRLPIAEQWKELAYERGKTSGDEDFFDLLEETLADPTPEANSLLEIFYTCMGLGFTGIYEGQPERLRSKMLEIDGRIRASRRSEGGKLLCEDAYNADQSNLVEPPGVKLIGIAIALIISVIVLFVGNTYLYHKGFSQLNDALTSIIGSEGAR